MVVPLPGGVVPGRAAVMTVVLGDLCAPGTGRAFAAVRRSRRPARDVCAGGRVDPLAVLPRTANWCLRRWWNSPGHPH
ncbi:hypothetical protein ACFUYE_15105 [Micromonospora humida]|uniref:hypothetical protein n=1 Tax=Micromonospora humida TaxID=2809018 RepID=UPI00366A8881